jgi:hypothetical protein
MQKALLFSENSAPILVSAEDVKSGKYDRYEEFVDPEYEYKVQYVSAAKNNGVPYFRMYLTRDEYKSLNAETKTRYDIIIILREVILIKINIILL